MSADYLDTSLHRSDVARSAACPSCSTSPNPFLDRHYHYQRPESPKTFHYVSRLHNNPFVSGSPTEKTDSPKYQKLSTTLSSGEVRPYGLRGLESPAGSLSASVGPLSVSASQPLDIISSNAFIKEATYLVFEPNTNAQGASLAAIRSSNPTAVRLTGNPVPQHTPAPEHLLPETHIRPPTQAPVQVPVHAQARSQAQLQAQPRAQALPQRQVPSQRSGSPASSSMQLLDVINSHAEGSSTHDDPRAQPPMSERDELEFIKSMAPHSEHQHIVVPDFADIPASSVQPATTRDDVRRVLTPPSEPSMTASNGLALSSRVVRLRDMVQNKAFSDMTIEDITDAIAVAHPQWSEAYIRSLLANIYLDPDEEQRVERLTELLM